MYYTIAEYNILNEFYSTFDLHCRSFGLTVKDLTMMARLATPTQI